MSGGGKKGFLGGRHSIGEQRLKGSQCGWSSQVGGHMV